MRMHLKTLLMSALLIAGTAASPIAFADEGRHSIMPHVPAASPTMMLGSGMMRTMPMMAEMADMMDACSQMMGAAKSSTAGATASSATKSILPTALTERVAPVGRMLRSGMTDRLWMW